MQNLLTTPLKEMRIKGRQMNSIKQNYAQMNILSDCFQFSSRVVLSSFIFLPCCKPSIKLLTGNCHAQASIQSTPLLQFPLPSKAECLSHVDLQFSRRFHNVDSEKCQKFLNDSSDSFLLLFLFSSFYYFSPAK